MSIFTRANWLSGLTYRQVCPLCKTVVIYMDDKLDFRPWYPDSFVYCPECTKPLRHNENYAIRPQRPDTDSSQDQSRDLLHSVRKQTIKAKKNEEKSFVLLFCFI